MRVLVTGGCGFIGSHFVKRLVAAGEEVTVLDKLTYAGNRANLAGVEHDFVQGDVADSAAVAEAGKECEAVVNFAAETHVDRSIASADDFVRTNVLGTHVLLEWARRAGVRLVQVSTDEVYGDTPDGARSTEDAPLRPSNPYAASKAGGDLHVLAYVRTFDLDGVLTRGANAYGPFQHPEKLVPLFVTNALDRRQLPLYGDGRQRRAWVHAEDQAAAIELVLRRGERGSIYNVGGAERENLEVAKLILELAGAEESLILHVEDRPGHDRRYCVDSARIKALGWQSLRTFEDGLADTVAWYRDRREWWEPLRGAVTHSFRNLHLDEDLGA
jgi:dTDP-glucose 4,6-dehydratase